jgi:CheY-like chemotaxis protein
MKNIHILLVEDNEGDVLLTTEALLESDMPLVVRHVKDGWEAIQYLNKANGYSKELMPDLILLDINLPKVNGHEVLRVIKTGNEFKHIPVIILTSSSSEKDKLEALQQHASSYFTKPSSMEDFKQIVQSVESFLSNL